jgi:hypothetical protein
MITCTECASQIEPIQAPNRKNPQTTCGSASCQRARKSRLQAERRGLKSPVTPAKRLPQRAIYNHEAPALNRYTVIQSHRGPTGTTETVVDSNMPLGEARKCSDTLQKAYKAAHPDQSSWTADVFYLHLATAETELSA